MDVVKQTFSHELRWKKFQTFTVYIFRVSNWVGEQIRAGAEYWSTRTIKKLMSTVLVLSWYGMKRVLNYQRQVLWYYISLLPTMRICPIKPEIVRQPLKQNWDSEEIEKNYCVPLILVWFPPFKLFRLFKYSVFVPWSTISLKKMQETDWN